MSFKRFASNSMHCLRIGLTSLALFQFSLGGPLASSAQAQSTNDGKTTTPIKHVIVIIGENRSFDHVFATYVPKPGTKQFGTCSQKASSRPMALLDPTSQRPTSSRQSTSAKKTAAIPFF